MRHYEKPSKTKQQWEVELLECLEEARKRLRAAKGEERAEALAHYQIVLKQFNGLTLDGAIPPEAPCYS